MWRTELRWKIFQRVIWALLALCVGGVILLLSVDFVIVIGPVYSGNMLLALLLVFLLALMVWGDGAIVKFTEGWEWRIALAVVLVIEGVFLMVLLSGIALADCGTQFVPLPAPEGRPTLVAMEESWLQGGWGSFYWRVGAGRLRYAGVDYTTDDGARPFQAGRYELEWGEDSVTVRFDTSAGWDSQEVVYPD